MSESGFSLRDLQRNPDGRDPRAPSLLVPHPGAGSPLGGRTVLLGLPYDGGIPTRPGARFGPASLRDALASFGTYDGISIDLGDRLPAVDLGNLDLAAMDTAGTHRRVEEAARRVWEENARPIFVGGDHGLTGSLIHGLAAARPDTALAIVAIDAHLDVREYTSEEAISSGTPFRRALETPIAAGRRTAIIGLRSFANSRYHSDWAREQGFFLATVDQVEQRGVAAVAAEALDHVMDSADALYLSIDLDAADVSAAPGVSASGVGGLTTREMVDLVRRLAGEPRLAGVDLMELSPPYDPDGRTAKLSARLLLEVLRLRRPDEQA